jgi:hypothetical protein
LLLENIHPRLETLELQIHLYDSRIMKVLAKRREKKWIRIRVPAEFRKRALKFRFQVMDGKPEGLAPRSPGKGEPFVRLHQIRSW